MGGSAFGNLYLWDVFSGNLLIRLNVAVKAITKLEFTELDSLLILADEEGTIRILNASHLFASKSQLFKDLGGAGLQSIVRHELRDHSQRVTDFIQTRQVTGKLFTVSLDKSFSVWDIQKGAKLSTNFIESEITCVTLSLDEYHLYLGCQNKNIYKFLIEDKSEIKKNQVQALVGHQASLISLRLLIETNQLLSASKDGVILVWSKDQIIKKISQFVSRPITVLTTILRPPSLDTMESSQLLGAPEKGKFSFKPLSKFEVREDQAATQVQRLVRKRIQKSPKLLDLNLFYKTQLQMMSGKSSKKAPQVNSRQVEELQKENELLKLSNQQLFNNQILRK